MQRWLIPFAACTLAVAGGCRSMDENPKLKAIDSVTAEPLPDLGSVGFAGPFAGENNGVLLAAGGTNFPADPPWKQGKKVWYDDVHAYDGTAWKVVGKLPKPNAVGASVTTPRGVMMLGGGDASTVFADVLLMSYVAGKVKFESLPSLPKPVMGCAAVQVGDRVFVAGGHNQISPMTDGPSRDVYSISVIQPGTGWRVEAPIPGAARWLPVVGSDGHSLFVISGMTPKVDESGKKVIHCLSDVWKYTPNQDGTGLWKQLADLPRANAAAPSPAPFFAGELFLLGGGVDDSNFGKPMDQRPPFPSTITVVDVDSGESRAVGAVKSSVVAAPVAPWRGGWTVVTGEVRAGVRSPTVWQYKFR